MLFLLVHIHIALDIRHFEVMFMFRVNFFLLLLLVYGDTRSCGGFIVVDSFRVLAVDAFALVHAFDTLAVAIAIFFETLAILATATLTNLYNRVRKTLEDLKEHFGQRRKKIHTRTFFFLTSKASGLLCKSS